jgi:hypothetical protein
LPIRCFLLPGFGIRDGKKSDSGIRDEHPRSFFLEFKQFLGLKILILFDADPDPGSGIFFTLDSGSEMEKFGSGIWNLFYPGSGIRDGKIGIRDVYLGSATLTVSFKFS